MIQQRRESKSRFPWYDSLWLHRYLNAKDFIAHHHSSRLVEFVGAFDRLRTRADFAVPHLKDAISQQAMMRIRTAIKACRPETLELHEIRQFGRWVVHDDPAITALQHSMIELVSGVVGEPVETSYNFLSLYTRLGRCGLHMDTPEAKWTLDICIDQSEPWPIHVSRVLAWPEDFHVDEHWESRVRSDPGNAFAAYSMNPGEALVFSGSSQWHYRDPLPPSANAFCHLLFMHFVPAGMSGLLLPDNWESIFGIPGLTDALA